MKKGNEINTWKRINTRTTDINKLESLYETDKFLEKI